MSKKQESTPEEKIKFANFLRATRTSHVLRRIAFTFLHTYQQIRKREIEHNPLSEKDYSSFLHSKLKYQNLEGYHIGLRPVSYKQAEFIYEMVQLGKYGGVDGASNPLPLFQIPDGFVLAESCLDDLGDDSLF